jgi:hypothetical protein
MTPATRTRHDKLKEFFTPDKNIVFVSSDNDDLEFEREMKRLAEGLTVTHITHTKSSDPEKFAEAAFSSSQENLFVVLAAEESFVDYVLASISSVRNSRRNSPPVAVIGTSRWARYENVDRNLYYRLNVSFVAPYHADRGNEAVHDFDGRYLVAFEERPSLFSYRGYDAVMMFGGAMLSGGSGGTAMFGQAGGAMTLSGRGGVASSASSQWGGGSNRWGSSAPAGRWGGGETFTDRLNSVGQPLQTRYRFTITPNGFHANDEWSLVTYRSNYTIEVR